MVEWLHKLNPLTYTSSEKYEHFWQIMFSTMLSGFWGRFLAVVLFVLSFWFGVRRRNMLLGAGLFAGSLTITFGAPFLKLVGLL